MRANSPALRYSLALLLLAACNSDDIVIDIPGNGNDPFDRRTVTKTQTFALDVTTRDANGVETVEFDRGEQIVIEHTLTNLSANVQTFEFPNPGYPWLCVRADRKKDCAWDSQHGKDYPQVVTPIQVHPFEVVKYRVNYAQLRNDNTALAAGDYEVKALYADRPNNEIFATVWHSFEIK